ncbi:MAG: glycosyltransferase family 4 protein [Gammaproteobacteria bacterium]
METYLFDLARELEPLGYDVSWFSMQHERNEPTPYARHFVERVEYHEHNSPGASVRSALRILYSRHARQKFERLLDEVQPDLVHAHNIYHQLSPAILPPLKRRGIPVVMTLHDLKLACPNYKMRTGGRVCERCLSGAFYNAVVHRCVQGSLPWSALCAVEAYAHRWTGVYTRNVDLFITPSEFYRRKMIESGIPADRLVTLPSFVHPQDYAPLYGKSDYFLYLGRLAEEKGLMTLVHAVRGLQGARLKIVGEGPMAAPIEARLRAEGIDNVELLGARYGQELIELVRAARFVVVPSEWYENSPRSAIEAMACATPVIGARIGGIPDIVEDGVDGLLFEPFSADALRNCIERLLVDDAAIERYGRNARAKVERRYSTQAHLRGLLGIYDRVLAAAPARS